MGMFGYLGAAIFETVTLPVSVIADAVTLGGAVIGRDTTFTGDKCRQIVNDVEDAIDELRD